ncbi:unannotated protein [freshwater metagenome]|uniref:Unannotated protein n=1 Tax=freshwater metagenome TaxID=449393 RepID=A0A6J6B4V8_9ZZZZ|nr:hypothetical protein [Actinomycetota bacterium]MTA05526.1 hypothetical protein [Actinomycetota bacterium]MTA37634.1 hypothetical protein [Actinomycetota bacterium]
MSNPSVFSRRGPSPEIPRGDVLSTVDTYVEAQSIVNRLAHAGYNVSNIAIVGRDLVTVERVTGRLTYARVALRGALNGAWFGLFFSLVLSLLSEPSTTFVMPAVIAIGAGMGVLITLAMYAIRRRRHDFSSVQQVLASRYEVTVPSGTAGAAQRALAEAPRDKP